MGNIVYREIHYEQQNKKNKNSAGDKREERRRNSLAFFVARYLKNEGDGFMHLVDEVREEKNALKPISKSSVRDASKTLK